MSKLLLEVGGNHLGHPEMAIELAEAAIEAGGTDIKYQLYTPSLLVNKYIDPARHEHFCKFELSQEIFSEIAKLCSARGATVSASVWDKSSLDFVDPLVEYHKVGSGDLLNIPLLFDIFEIGKPVILSTGLASGSEVKKVVSLLLERYPHYSSQEMLCVMQCTSVYPCPNSQINLNVIRTYQKMFPELAVGFSDHSVGSRACELAACLGVEWIEKHFALDRDISDFRDLKCSIIPSELKSLIERIEFDRILLGSHKKSPTHDEIEQGHNLTFRRALYLNRDMCAGEVVSKGDLISLRPSVGISSSEYQYVIGNTLLQPVKAFEALEKKY